MSNLNRVFLMGRLTRDPEQRFITSGQAVVNIGLAVNRTYTTNGEKREETAFIDIEAWGPQGDLIHRYLKKGNPIFVEGRLKFDQWETKEGEKRSKLRVVLERFQFIGGTQRANQTEGESLDPADFGITAPYGGGDGGGGGETAGGESSQVPF